MQNRFENGPVPHNKRKKHHLVRQSFILRGDNLGHKVVYGAGFTFLGIILRTLITLSSVAVLARLLSPADFGYIAMATVITEFAALFGNMGFSSVLIQKRAINRLQIDTVFWASTLLGLCLAITVFFLSYFAAWLYHQPMVGELMRVMCFTFLTEELVVVHGTIISRLMRFRLEFVLQVISVLARTTIAIAFALMGFGVWSLVIGALAGSVFRVALYVAAVPFLPRMRFSLDYLRATWKTNGSYFVGGFLFYANMNIDLFIIGRLLGATVLGYYQNARSLTDEIRFRMAQPLQRVLFPAFSTLQKDRYWLQAAVLRSGRLLAAIFFPIGFGIAAIASELVPVLYGSKWLAMVPVLKFLAIRTAIAASTSIATPLFNSQNKVGLALRYNIIGTILSVLSVIIASHWGMKAVAAAIAACSLYSLTGYRAGLGLIGLTWHHVWSLLAPPAFAATVMWTAIGISRIALTQETGGHLSVLLFHIALGAVVYPVILYLCSPLIWDDFKAVIAKMVSPPKNIAGQN